MDENTFSVTCRVCEQGVSMDHLTLAEECEDCQQLADKDCPRCGDTSTPNEQPCTACELERASELASSEGRPSPQDVARAVRTAAGTRETYLADPGSFTADALADVILRKGPWF